MAHSDTAVAHVYSDQDQLLTPADAARYLTKAKATLAKQRLAGGGPEFLKLGKSIRYRRSALDRYLDSCRRTSTSDRGDNL